MTPLPESLKILLIEDSRVDAILIEKVLAQSSPTIKQVQKAETLAAALQILAEHEFDAVLLDLSLPDTTEFHGLLNIQNIAPKLPIIILTAHENEDFALSAVQHGAQDYLYKDKVDGHAIKRALYYAIQRKRFEEVLITRAHFDPLTHLANRALFESRLDMAIARRMRSGEGIGVFFLDLDRFKQVNDQMGHAAGDQLLQQVAIRLNHSVRPYDTVARFGGDEFALLIDGLKQTENCLTIANKIIAQIDEPFVLEDKTVDIGISIGIVTCLASDPVARETLMRQADEAMYAAKQLPHSGYRVYAQLVEKKAFA